MSPHRLIHNLHKKEEPFETLHTVKLGKLMAMTYWGKHTVDHLRNWKQKNEEQRCVSYA